MLTGGASKGRIPNGQRKKAKKLAKKRFFGISFFKFIFRYLKLEHCKTTSQKQAGGP
jgi:hypothetical protein